MYLFNACVHQHNNMNGFQKQKNNKEKHRRESNTNIPSSWSCQYHAHAAVTINTDRRDAKFLATTRRSVSLERTHTRTRTRTHTHKPSIRFN